MLSTLKRAAAVMTVAGALVAVAPLASANAQTLPALPQFPAVGQICLTNIPGIVDFGPLGQYGPLGPHGPLGPNAPACPSLADLGPDGPLGPHGPLAPPA